MVELDPLASKHVLASVRQLPINTLFVQSVLCGHADGTIFVDNLNAPTAFYAVHSYGMSLLWGHSDCDHWHSWLRDYLRSTTRPIEWLQIFPTAWSTEVEAILHDRFVDPSTVAMPAGALRCTRVNFEFDCERYLCMRPSEELDHATFAPMSERTFAALEGSVVPKRFWRSATTFLEIGGGVHVLVDGEIAATAFCSFRHGSYCEIGIETAVRHRGKGFGRLVACAMIDACMKEGLHPVWACRLENTASFRLATKLGFAPGMQLPYYRLPGCGP